MNNAEKILSLQNLYDSSTRDEILNTLNTAIAIGKDRKLKVDRYIALPEVTGRSKYAVMSWFNRPDKIIPLIDLCMIANYLSYNIFTFFKIKKDVITFDDFLETNNYCVEHYPSDAADVYIQAFKLQKSTDKDTIVDNLEKLYGSTADILKNHSNARQKTIMDISGCTLYTYRTWFNRSRKEAKIPLIPLCKLAIGAVVDIFYMFEVHDK